MPPQKSISSPTSSVSATETILPTSDLPFSKSLRQVAQMSVDEVPDDNDVFSQSTVLNHSVALGSPEESKTPQAEVPSISVASTVRVDDASPTPHSRHNATPIVRPPPPRIFLRRENAEKPTRVTASGTEHRSSHRQAAAKGLNISGLPLPEITTNTIVEQGYIEDKPSKEDENDALPELASPRRLNFGNSENAPVSPAWQSIESPKSNQYSPGGKRQSIHCFTSQPNLEIPSPLGPKFRRFEPTPNHGIHSRNLSLFFPQPGSTLPPKSTSPGLIPSPEFGETTLIPSSDSSNEKKVFGGAGNWSFGQARPEAGGSAGLLTPDVKRSKRRGHHHKHSLSHNFFSFLDPTQTNPALSSNKSSARASPNPDATPASVPMPRLPSSATIQTLSPLPSSKLDHYSRFLLSFAFLEFIIGAGLWIEGQMSGWRCLAGVGYLVVFDAMGVAVSMVGRKEGAGWSSIRKPFGPSRFISLLYFAQSLFLVFAAVYIAKESIEQVILGSGAHDHAVGGHGHEGSHSHGGESERSFPHFLLLCAAAASTFSGAALGNHCKLVDAVGSLFLTPTYLSLPIVSRYSALLANPFSLTVVTSSLGILLSTMIVPPSSLHSLDALISLLLTLFTSSLSYPPTIFFAHILLQTAPPSSTPQMIGLKRALREIKEDRRVLGLGIVRCWAVSVGKGGWNEFENHGQSSASRQGSIASSPVVTPRGSTEFPPFPASTFSSLLKDKEEPSAPLVVTLTVHVDSDLGDQEVLDVTKMAWSRVHQVVGKGGGERGEVGVSVKKGWEGVEEM
ncbi:hypothetical protein C343_00854 [Cryptococcus neoformans C23]|uniref:Cation efflux protein transmembrane domain-containing protein n=1 Tax=Cryptococcus neoformans (strain H99 / ATCC 208821 / CBS 10515 / FGSC 9487) TaxID=235443 RepID=J9VFW0_CRYN9|nr:hypothetical protein CNAG_00837 [Cryptococcus neoformans var. grubii H99]AUB22451.1 hypothetical protein CKF44_00837 [Cryptococcus neoformans var. grubii]OWZ36078.1 hypothetical protein C347_00927 [Cryptococcus neoformans var. grubii AD2-60a]OWZ47727.1 hypothetical protein C343_00854 [Cryptococcus neoformans var. grubii C23]OXC86819.1 hypothetical protein C344_00861 [Cryptococcus neoformans var. grubii AD1-7a]OXG45776.1 hypothetical protein C359_00465 [Cryptococcus neoformans var. grubii Bt|eukprot:XP_012046445.1 hypothetical protein CNAG_00837 [Cryptococcus neoformans var. grubii H99]